jgi:hypothetical protein
LCEHCLSLAFEEDLDIHTAKWSSIRDTASSMRMVRCGVMATTGSGTLM